MCNNVRRSILLFVYVVSYVDAYAVQPPSWSDPKINPCAKIANGWQHLYYPPLDRCFKIFTLGFPCPETMELSPLENGEKINRKKIIKYFSWSINCIQVSRVMVNAHVRREQFKSTQLRNAIKSSIVDHVKLAVSFNLSSSRNSLRNLCDLENAEK